MGESNAVRIRRPLMRQATAKRAAEIYAERFMNQDGLLPATYQVPLSFSLFAYEFSATHRPCAGLH